MASLSHPMRAHSHVQQHVSMKELSISLHRCRQNGLSEPSDTEPKSFCSSLGAFREAPGASWGLLGPPGVSWEAPGRPFGVSWDLSRSFLGPSGGCPGISFALHVAPVAQMGSNPIHPGREGSECHFLPRGVPCVVVVLMWREGGWECIFHNWSRSQTHLIHTTY